MRTSTKLLAVLGAAALALPAAAGARPSADDHPGAGNPGPPDHSDLVPDHPSAGDHPGPSDHPGPNDHPSAADNPGSEHQAGGGEGPKVAYVFKGTYNEDGTVTVERGNNHVRKADLVGEAVEFDLSGAKLTVADTNGDGATDVSDVQADDRVVVTAKLPKSDPGDQPFDARRLVDQTNPPDDEDDDDGDGEDPTA
jgi:hypothetical protein